MKNVVEVTNLTKSFKNKRAVDDVSFNIKKGEVVALLGPNGAGKTTTILMMLGLLHPSQGNAKVFGDFAKKRTIKERIGVMLQEVSLMDGLKVKEILQLFRSYYPHPLSLEELIDITGLQKEDLKKRVEKLSGGQKRRVAFALALAGDPDLLFIDEPTVGMDVKSRKQFWKKIHQFAAKGKTILFSTHYLQEADDIADRIILFNKGTIVADGSPVEIKDKLTKQSVSFKTKDKFPKEAIINESFVTDCVIENGKVTVMTNNTDAVLKLIHQLSFDIQDIQIEKGRLEEAFEELITDDEREAV